jgi:hypothetical protein
VETTDAKGTLHSSYLLVDGLEHRSVIDNLVVAIHQSPVGQKSRHRQPVEELPTDEGFAAAESVDKEDGQDDPAVDDDDDEIKAFVYVDCQPVGIISLAGSLRHLIQQSPSGALVAVKYFQNFNNIESRA